MFARRVVGGLVLAVGFIGAGCSLSAAEDPMDGSLSVMLQPAVPTDPEDNPPGSLNGFAPACAWQSGVIPAYREFGRAALWDGGLNSTGTLPSNSIMDDPDIVDPACREEALTYLVRCAMPQGSIVIDPVTLARYSGWLGLGSDWRTNALSTDNQWWVTACVMQHLNGFDLPVPIMLDGARDGLFPSLESDPLFTKKDSRIWGNMFNGTSDFVPNVCYESDLLDSCTDFTIVDIRLCDTDPSLNCNLNIVGACEDVCTYVKPTPNVPGSGGYACGSAGLKNIGSRMENFGMYGSTCPF